jgi:hypothetical protein
VIQGNEEQDEEVLQQRELEEELEEVEEHEEIAKGVALIRDLVRTGGEVIPT